MDKMTIVIYVSGIAGMVTHVVKKIIKKETMSSIVQYYTGNIRSTITAITTTMGLITAVTVSDVCNNEVGAMCMWLLASGAYSAGYMFDSMFNKDGGKK